MVKQRKADPALFGKVTLEDVPIDKMRVRAEISQRNFDPAWADHIAQNFNPDVFEPLVVNKTGDWYWIIDGQHRKHGACQWLGEWEDQTLRCWVYHDLDVDQEARMFDLLNSRKHVSAFDRFVVRRTGGLEVETNVDAIVRMKKLKVSRQRGEGAVSCPNTLCAIYKKSADCLSRALTIVYEAFGDSGLEADILGGAGNFVNRFDGVIDDNRAIRSLHGLRGGVASVRSRAERMRQQMGNPKAHCVAAAMVEVYNRGKGGKKLPSYWKHE